MFPETVTDFASTTGIDVAGVNAFTQDVKDIFIGAPYVFTSTHIGSMLTWLMIGMVGYIIWRGIYKGYEMFYE